MVGGTRARAHLFLILAPLLLLAPGASADQGASARVQPAVATPGTTVELIFAADSPELAEVIVQGRITCAVTSPSGRTQTACDVSGPLVEARVAGSGQRTVAFPYVAPSEMGVHRVHFEASSLVTILPQTYSADASFEVRPAEGSNGDDGGGDGPPGGTPTPSGSPSPTRPPDGPPSEDDSGDAGLFAAGADAARWMVSTSLAAAAILMTLVGRRWPPGNPI